MIRLCVIGNSHIGSLKRGWDVLSANPPYPIEIIFFGHRADRLDGLEIADGRLRPNNPDLEQSLAFTSGGETSIDPRRFDHILLYGMGTQPWIFPPNIAYSQAVVKRAAEDLTSNTLSIRTLNKIRRIYDGPIQLGHDPLPAIEPSEHVETTAYLTGLERLNTLIYQPLNARLWPQPLDTIVNGRNTSLVYSVGSKRLAVDAERGDDPHGEDDRIHMNDRFGALWLEAFLSALEPGSASVAHAAANACPLFGE